MFDLSNILDLFGISLPNLSRLFYLFEIYSSKISFYLEFTLLEFFSY